MVQLVYCSGGSSSLLKNWDVKVMCCKMRRQLPDGSRRRLMLGSGSRQLG